MIIEVPTKTYINKEIIIKIAINLKCIFKYFKAINTTFSSKLVMANLEYLGELKKVINGEEIYQHNYH